MQSKIQADILVEIGRGRDESGKTPIEFNVELHKSFSQSNGREKHSVSCYRRSKKRGSLMETCGKEL